MRQPLVNGGRVAAAAVLVLAALGMAGPANAAAAGADLGAPPGPEPHSFTARHGLTAAQRTREVPNELLKEALAEEEEGADQDLPTLSALCKDYLGQPNPYHATAPNVDAINHDGTVATGSMAGCSAAQNETTIAVNNYNPRNLVAGANDYRVYNAREGRNDASTWAYTTLDGGRTWTDVMIPGVDYQSGATGALSYMDAAGDPAVAFGPGNTVYYASLTFSRTDPYPYQMASGLTVSVSHDGGLTWDSPSIVQLDGVTPAGTYTPTTVFNDKEWIAADPVTGTVYVTWTRFTFDADGNYLESPIYARKSTDFGVTWGPATRVAPELTGFNGGITPYDQGSNPEIGNDGTLYVAYEASVCRTAACTSAGDHDAVVVATSKDGGQTFKNQEVALDFDFPATLTGENFRLNSYPLMSYDRVTDRLWVTWADDRNGTYGASGSIRTNGDVFVVGSRSGSSGWSSTMRVGTGQDEFFPAVASFSGRVAVSYYTRGYDPDGIGVDYAYSVGWNTGIDGGAVRRITTETENPQVQFVGLDSDGTVLQGVFIGDYSDMALGFDFQLHPCWTDFRGNPGVNTPNQDAYSQSIQVLF